MMIARHWSATATASGADWYETHFVGSVLPGLRAMVGFRGGYLLRNDNREATEIRVLTMWDTVEAIEGFAGPDATAAIVAPEAQAALLSFDPVVTHYDVVVADGAATS
ncbi:antibiotic biosynthesis monooxygenase [Rugosimonospora africana]|uniref:Antibiotic biosynthesis monooxygenase n=2 Tax=Rugosimonospora africana TaxID=556532 RepID=A0A8J3R2G4_9ACTN|nr:antibiotic biosynthesis monooxygenase [Rugosimonospora africana]